MSNENDPLAQPAKASKNKPLKSAIEIFTVLFDLIVMSFLPLFIFFGVFTFPFIIEGFYNYYLDHHSLPLYQLFIYFSIISVIILISALEVRKFGADYFAKYFTLYRDRKFSDLFIRGLLIGFWLFICF